MDVTLPPGAKLLTITEAVRRIQERDHVVTGPRASFDVEQALIALIREELIGVVLMPDGQIGFTPLKDEDGNPVNIHTN